MYKRQIYQEQVINIAVDFANYSLGEADMLRRAMGKKKPEVMAKEKELFFERAVKNKRDKKTAEKIFSYLEPFADYGFNKSHSACSVSYTHLDVYKRQVIISIPLYVINLSTSWNLCSLPTLASKSLTSGTDLLK